METRSFKLNSEYIELNKLLKAENFVSSGGEAKLAIKDGSVLVDGEPESRLRRKLYAGMTVSYAGSTVEIV